MGKEAVVRPTITNNVILICVNLLFVFIGATTDTADISDVEFGALIAFEVLMVIGILLFSVRLVMGLPKIMLDSSGVRYRDVFRSSSWNWDQCGKFHLVTVKTYHRGIALKHRYASAFNSRNQRAIDAEGARIKPDMFNGDIHISLTGTEVGVSEKRAQEFVDQLNRLRAAFATASTEPSKSNRTLIAALKSRASRKKWIYFWIMTTLIIISTFLIIKYK